MPKVTSLYKIGDTYIDFSRRACSTSLQEEFPNAGILSTVVIPCSSSSPLWVPAYVPSTCKDFMTDVYLSLAGHPVSVYGLNLEPDATVLGDLDRCIMVFSCSSPSEKDPDRVAFGVERMLNRVSRKAGIEDTAEVKVLPKRVPLSRTNNHAARYVVSMDLRLASIPCVFGRIIQNIRTILAIAHMRADVDQLRRDKAIGNMPRIDKLISSGYLATTDPHENIQKYYSCLRPGGSEKYADSSTYHSLIGPIATENLYKRNCVAFNGQSTQTLRDKLKGYRYPDGVVNQLVLLHKLASSPEKEKVKFKVAFYDPRGVLGGS